ncbi:hypothetical protein ND748_23515, partial [Frankia sp. AiPs1]|nr:hypothetical protein [Frankia sp. AiPs1]
VRAARDGRSVLVSWRPSTTAGEVRYRVTRFTADGVGRAVGVTAGSSLEDGGAPPDGAIPRYEVAAGAGGAWSAPVGTAEPGPPPADPMSPADLPEAVCAAPAIGAADALSPPGGLRWVDERLQWTWPAGCTEMMVVCRSDGPPTAADDPRAQARKVTNTRYEIDGGVPLPPGRPLHVALFNCARQAGRLTVAASAGARLRLVPGGDGTGR